MNNHEVIDLIDSDDDCKPAAKPVSVEAIATKRPRRSTSPRSDASLPQLPASLVLEEDQDFTEHEILTSFRKARQTDPSLLFQDLQFAALPSSIHGMHKKSQPTCRCRGSRPAKLQYKKTNGRPYYSCANQSCQYFSWAFQAESMQWYRFGTPTGHVVTTTRGGFSASDLCQGRVGDCWFLSALAVVAERDDLISRLFPKEQPMLAQGLVQVNLFLDGKWETVVVDNFLPCLVDSKSELALQQAIRASMGASPSVHPSTTASGSVGSRPSSSKYDPFAIADECRQTLRNTQEFLEQHQRKTLGKVVSTGIFQLLERPVTSQDLAYSTAKDNQLWVPFIEKAYAKSHGSYNAISGGHIAEAFLDLTGAPTEVYQLHSQGFSPRSFWYKLLGYRKQRLPMGCGTDSSAAGIIGMHAYSILDVIEVKNVPFSFFQETGVAHGNVSGFTEYDGTVRLLKIRNPHGKGEWKGDFSDKSQIWERLLQHGNSSGLERSMKNDGVFYIDYDNFLMGFANVDVVLCHVGNHARSFSTNFAAKKSNHRCVRAFEVSLLDEQPGLPNRETVELFLMGIQKTRRGAANGRTDRKKSYKVSDLGLLVGEGADENLHFATVTGRMFGFRRDGHHRLILDRKKTRRMIVMPISFGHPAATDKELPFTLRFVSDAPLLIQELPEVPRLDMALQKFCIEAPLSSGQGVRKILLEDTLYRMVQIDCRGNGGGVVFLYLCLNEIILGKQGNRQSLSFTVEANCRGMSCRTESGLLEHKTVAKGKKFEAAWRRYSADFIDERQSRLLLVLYQSGQDTEFGSMNCKCIPTPKKLGSSMEVQTTLQGLVNFGKETGTDDAGAYDRRGVFNGVSGTEFERSASLQSTSVCVTSEWQINMDDELERALALSRGDLEVKEALEASRQLTADTAPDTDLQRALEASKNESRTGEAVADDYDDELARAIQMSIQPESTPVIVDLTDEFSSPNKHETRSQGTSPMKRKAIEVVGTPHEKPMDRLEKRRLASEAAMKRMQR